MSIKNIKQLSETGHEIGLHSTKHYTNLGNLSDTVQYQEYSINKEQLENITKSKIRAVAYPVGSYNNYTLTLMKKLNITTGFISSMDPKKKSMLEISRYDCANLNKIVY